MSPEAGLACQAGEMNLIERLRHWWKPAEYEEDHPLSEEERAALQHLPHGSNVDTNRLHVNVDDEFKRQ